MAENNETIADIVAEQMASIKYLGDELPVSISAGSLRNLLRRLEAAHGRELGNAAKLREALEKIQDNIYFNDIDGCIEIDIGEDALDKLFEDALAAPARNCDKGTADEQYARFVDMCHANVDLTGRCRATCPFKPASTALCDRAECFARWSQMPYKEEVKNEPS